MVETFALAEGAATPPVRARSRHRVRSLARRRVLRRCAPTEATASPSSTITCGGSRSRARCKAVRPPSIASACGAALAAVLRATRHPESRIRVTFAPPELFASIEPFEPLPEDLYKDGAWCVTVPLHREQPQSKDTRFLSSAQGAYRELPAGVHEGLLLGTDGALLEGLSSNVFAVVDGVLRTEKTRGPCMARRARSCSTSRAGWSPSPSRPSDRRTLSRAAEMFLTSVSREVLGSSASTTCGSAAGNRERWRRS